MVIDPREGNVNAQARRARALLFPIPRVNNHVDMDTEDFIPFITFTFLLKVRHIYGLDRVLWRKNYWFLRLSW